MANILEDNSVIPSYMGSMAQGDSYGDPGTMTNLSFKTGEVREIIYPDDKRNVNQRFIEYIVEVQEKDGSGPGTSTRYAGCVVSNLFGSVADILRFTYRADKKDQPTEDGIGVGAKVAMLCVNGDTTKAVIIGGFRDTGTDTSGDLPQGKDLKDDGHNLFFEFNGIQISINKDGELQVRYRGATKVDATLSDDADADAEGSTIIFTKEGGIKAYTKDEAQFVHIDHKNKKLDILADEQWHVKVNKKLAFEAGDEITVKGDKTCTIEMSDKVFIKSAGVHVGGASEDWMMGSTFRQQQQTLHNTMLGQLNTLSGLISTAATSLQAASVAQKVPVAGAIAASVPLQLAATALTSAGPIFSALASAITSFEAQAATYLSKKNKND